MRSQAAGTTNRPYKGMHRESLGVAPRTEVAAPHEIMQWHAYQDGDPAIG